VHTAKLGDHIARVMSIVAFLLIKIKLYAEIIDALTLRNRLEKRIFGIAILSRLQYMRIG
jgi:hypothetical protein